MQQSAPQRVAIPAGPTAPVGMDEGGDVLVEPPSDEKRKRPRSAEPLPHHTSEPREHFQLEQQCPEQPHPKRVSARASTRERSEGGSVYQVGWRPPPRRERGSRALGETCEGSSPTAGRGGGGGGAAPNGANGGARAAAAEDRARQMAAALTLKAQEDAAAAARDAEYESEVRELLAAVRDVKNRVSADEVPLPPPSSPPL